MTPMITGPVTHPGPLLAALALATAALTAPLAGPAGFAGVGPALAHAAPMPPGSRGTVGIALADHAPATGADPRAHRYIVGHLEPGRTLTRTLRVSNDTDSPQRLELYAGPAAIDQGRFLPAEPGASSALTRWITVDPPVVRLAPGGSTQVRVTLAAPADAPAREHYGVIWASHTSAAPAKSDAGAPSGSGDQAAGLDLISRVGVRVYVSTGEGPPAGPDFEIVDLRPVRDALGAAALMATVANVGGRAVEVAGTLELTDGPGGLTAPPVPAEPVTLAPGDSAEVPFHLPADTALPTGQWRASLDLSSGSVRREAARTVGLETGHAAPPPEIGEPTGRMVLAAVTLAALVLPLCTWWAVSRRRR